MGYEAPKVEVIGSVSEITLDDGSLSEKKF